MRGMGKGERMALPVFYANDANVSLLRDRRIAVLGYGSQGRAHAQNLRDCGLEVMVAQRPGGESHRLAIEHGFKPVSLSDATANADLLIFTLPDERMGELFESDIAPKLRPGQALGFAHGFAIRFGLVRPPPTVDVILVAPKGPGTLVRSAFMSGGGLTCLFGVHQDATGKARELALAWAASIGGGRGGMIETTFAVETESDLFGEQAVLCGGVIELVKAAFDVLVEAGYPSEAAYFECVHELKQIVDLIYTDGLEGMRSRISRTAAYGGLTRGSAVVNDETRRRMRAILEDIRSGKFAEEFVAQTRAASTELTRLMQSEQSSDCAKAGRTVLDIVRRALPGARAG
jgi:ketol-acid reductoisomerase